MHIRYRVIRSTWLPKNLLINEDHMKRIYAIVAVHLIAFLSCKSF